MPTAACSTRFISPISNYGFHFQKTQQPAGLRTGAGIHRVVSQPDRPDPAGRDVSESVHRSAGTSSGISRPSPRAVASYRLTFGASLIGALINLVFGVLVAWVLVRYSFPGKRLFDSLVDLPFALPTAVAGHCPDHDLRAQRLAGPAAGVARNQVRLFSAGSGHRADFYRTAVRSSKRAAGARRHGQRTRGSCGQSGSQPLADFFARGAAHNFAGGAGRFCHGLCPRSRRIRLGGVHLRKHADENRDYAAADYHQARSVRLRGRDRDRRGHAGVLFDPVAAHQPFAEVEQQPRGEDHGTGSARRLSKKMATTIPLSSRNASAGPAGRDRRDR